MPPARPPVPPHRALTRARPRPAAALAVLLVAAALALATAPAIAADGAPGERAHEVQLSVLAYHPYPDLDGAAGGPGDPFGVPDPDGPGRDRFFNAYDGRWFPTVRVDGILEHAQPDGDTSGSVSAMRAAYEALVRERLRLDSPVTLTVNGTVNATTGEVTATFHPRADVASDRMQLRVIVFEDDVPFEAANGVDVHRFTVRHVAPAETVPGFRAGEAVAVTRAFDVDANWTVANLGVVAFAQNRDPSSVHAADQEVLQSATYRFDQANATVQVRKAALLEMYTATWCAPCLYGDHAVDALAEDYGVGSARVVDAGWAYLRAPTLGEAAAGAVLAVLLGVALWPRREGAR